MNNSGFSRIVVTFAVMILALYISLDVFAGGRNAFGKFYMYALVGGGIVGLVSPRKGFFFLLFLTAYLDYFKRLMILDNGISTEDLYCVLGIAPATMAGITISVIYNASIGSEPRRPWEGWLMGGTIAVVGLTGALGALSGGGGFRAAGDLVNSAIYLFLIFVIPAIFRTPDDLRYLLKTSILMFIPSVCYYLYQTFAGFTWWEMEYMLRGYTIEIRQLNERVPRVFGTLNGAGAATVIYSIDVALLLFGGFWKYRDDSGQKKDGSIIPRVFLAFFFAFAAYRTFSRTGWVQGLIAAVCFWAFRSRFFTRAFYGGAIFILGVTVAFSGYMVKHNVLSDWNGVIQAAGASDESLQATNLSTLNARLDGFYFITNDSRLWTPFGVGWQGRSVEQALGNRDVHDAFSAMLLRVGYVPLLIGIMLAYFVLRAVHRFVNTQTDGLSATLGAACLGSAIAVASAATVSGAALSNYPVNFYLYFYMGIVVSLMLYHAQIAKEAKQAAVAKPEREPMLRNRSSPYLRNNPPAPAPGGNRFRPALHANRD
jgi:hypothetical protein